MIRYIWLILVCLLLSGCGLLPAADQNAVQQTGNTQPTSNTEPPGEAEETQPTMTSGKTQPENIKAMWLTQFDMEDIYRSGDSQRSREEFTEKAEVILENIASMGFNTLFLQVRPNADSMYPSQVYPMSRYVVGQYAGTAAYDPVELLVALAGEKGLSVHAWINPMRGMKEAELALVSEEYSIGRWARDPDKLGRYLVLHNGMWYLNPAYAPVRALIAAGAKEALEKYDFDGLHIDDYFYPTTDTEFDRQAYSELGGGRELDDFRRQSLNALVSLLYDTAHEQGAVFSVSPAGNIGTVYDSHYADVYTWCSQEGYLDYICPQVYFGLEHENFDFAKVCRTFSDIIHTDSVGLIVGMTFGKAMTGEDPYAGSGKDEWKENQDILKRCLEYTRELEHCRGVAVFCYQYFYDPLTGEPIQETSRERENFLPVFGKMEWINR